jgi:endonuclease-3
MIKSAKKAPAKPGVPNARKISAKLEKPNMMRESEVDRKKRLGKIFDGLHKLYPDAKCELDFTNAYELIVATILSAQCTDQRVNMVMKDFKKTYPTVQDLARSVPEALETVIRSTGFYRQKTKSLISMATDVVEKYHGNVPETMEELTGLRGVGRKTANVVMGNAFGIAEGIAVDTHVTRLSGRLGLSKESSPEGIEQDLMKLSPQSQWVELSHLLILHGRRVCDARKPRCSDCTISALCPSKGMPGSV